MKIQPIKPISFGIRLKPTRKIQYAPNCFIEREIGKYKGYNIMVSKNFTDNKLTSRLIYIKDKSGNWLASKLKYLEGTVWKVLKGGKNA